MTKLAIFKQAFVAGSIIFVVAEGLQIPSPDEKRLQAGIVGNIRHLHDKNITQMNIVDPKFLEYFKAKDIGGENERHESSPRRNPVLYIHQEIWKNATRRQPKEIDSLWARFLRRLQDIGFDDNYYNGEKNRADDNFNNPHGYNNYRKEDLYEHDETLVTEDDALSFNFDDFDDDPPTGTPPQPNSQPTIAPTPLDTTFWKEVEAMDSNLNLGGYDYNDYDLLQDHPENSVILKIVLGVVNMDENKDDTKNIVNMAARAISTVLNNDEGIPFLVWDSLDIHNRKRKRKMELTETPTFPKSFRGQGDPQEPFDARTNGREDEYLAKLILDSAKVAPGDYNWWEISAIYTVWRKGDLKPVNDRHILWQIQKICEHSIEMSIEQQIYWAALGDQELVIPGKIYFMDDKGVVDAKDVGEEYDMSSLYCPINRPLEVQDFVCPTNEPNITYSFPIADSLVEVEWGIREWVGLGLMCSTMFFVISLSLIADFVNKRRRRQLLWGAALTHDGVDDILQVGWRIYEQPPQEQAPVGLTPEEVQQQQAQLYLQIYDKGGEGYNDENSLLKGGVEQQVFAPSTDAYAAAAVSPPLAAQPAHNKNNIHENIAHESIVNPNKSPNENIANPNEST